MDRFLDNLFTLLNLVIKLELIIILALLIWHLLMAPLGGFNVVLSSLASLASW